MSQSYARGYQGYMNPAFPVVIASGQSTSAAIPMNGFSLCGIKIPDTFTGSNLTFLACETLNGEYLPIYSSTQIVSYAATQGAYVAIDPKDFHGVLFLKIVSGASEAALRNLLCSVKGF